MNNQPDYEKFESARKKQSAKIGQKRQDRFGEKRAPPRPVRNVGNSPFQIRRKQNLRRAQKYGKRRKKRLKQNYERNGAFETPLGQVKPSKTTQIHMSKFLAATAQKSTKKPRPRRICRKKPPPLRGRLGDGEKSKKGCLGGQNLKDRIPLWIPILC